MSVGTGPLLIPPSSNRLVVHGRGLPEVYLNYDVVLIIALQKSDSVIHIFFFTFFSIMVYHRILNMASCAVQEDLVIYPFFICQFSSAIPNSNPILPHSYPYGSHKSVLYVLDSVSDHRSVSFGFLWLTYLYLYFDCTVLGMINL